MIEINSIADFSKVNNKTIFKQHFWQGSKFHLWGFHHNKKCKKRKQEIVSGYYYKIIGSRIDDKIEKRKEGKRNDKFVFIDAVQNGFFIQTPIGEQRAKSKWVRATDSERIDGSRIAKVLIIPDFENHRKEYNADNNFFDVFFRTE